MEILKKNWKILMILISFNTNAQTYIIDNLKVIGEEKTYFDKNVDIKIVYCNKEIRFYKVELDSTMNVTKDIIYQTYKTTNPNFISGKVRFICYNKNYELQFFEITDRNITEKFIGFTKIYHIKTIYK